MVTRTVAARRRWYLRRMSTTPPASPRARRATTWFIVGLLCALGPLWLFSIAAFVGLGPASATWVFAAPVLLSTVVAIWAVVRLRRLDAARAAITVGVVLVLAGVLGYFLWVNLAILGMTMGDGPL